MCFFFGAGAGLYSVGFFSAKLLDSVNTDISEEQQNSRNKEKRITKKRFRSLLISTAGSMHEQTVWLW